MYLNFNELTKTGTSPNILVFLLAVKQGNINYLEDNEHILIEVEDYTQLIKGTKKQTTFQKIRLNKKGKELLSKLESFEIDNDDEKVFSFMKEVYIQLGKEIGNSKKTKRYINWFKKETGIRRNRLIFLLKTFVSDKENMQYNNVLEYVFYKPPTVFETKPKLEESRLYNYYLKKEEQFEKIWSNNDKYYE